MKTANLGIEPKAVAGARLTMATDKKNRPNAGTADFLTDLLQKHEKMAWMLRSLLLHHGA